MNDPSFISWVDVPKGIIIEGILYTPIERTEQIKNDRCMFCECKPCLDNSKMQDGAYDVAYCQSFGKEMYLKRLGKITDVFIETPQRKSYEEVH